MKERQNILNELHSISRELGRLSEEVPYEVPVGYFDGLADRMLALAKAMDAPLPAVLQEVKSNPFTVPAGYFDNLPARLLARVQADSEEISSVLKAASGSPYTVPAGYFETLPELLLMRAKDEMAADAQEELATLSPLLSGLSKKMPFAMPEGYFKDLTENAISGARAIGFVNEELENLSPLMAGLQGIEVYEAPAGYFEALPGELLNKAKTAVATPAGSVSTPVRVISFATRLMRYAVAAAVVGIIAVGAWWFSGNDGKTVDPDLARQEQKVNKELNDNLGHLSEADLQSYLEEETAPLSGEILAMNTKSEDIKAVDVSDMLVDVSDEEIQKYLEQNTFLTKKTFTN